MPAHPTEQELALFLRGAHKELGSKVVRHLLTGCPICQERLKGLRREAQVSAPPSYDRAFAKAEHILSLFLENGRRREEPPEAILAELFTCSLGEAPSVSENRAAIPALVRWLTQRSHKARYSNPEQMLHWGLMGRLAADACSAEVAGSPSRLADLRALAWGHFGNALRVSGRISESEEALATAQRHAGSGTGDPILRARLQEQATALFIFQRRFADALESDAEAAQIYSELGDRHHWARVSVQEAIVWIYSGESERAATILKGAIPLIKSDADPHLAAAARHNLARCYIDANRPTLAKLAYLEARDLCKDLPDNLIHLRTLWQEGQLLRSLDHLEAAESTLLRTQEGFLRLGLAFEVAVVTRDIATVLQQMGETQRLEQLLTRVSNQIRALPGAAEALASLEDFMKSPKLRSPDAPVSR